MIPLKLQRLLLLFSCQVKSGSETPWTAAHQRLLSSTISWSLLKFTSIESVVLHNHLILCFPLLLLPSIFPSIRVFSSESALHIRGPKCWTFSFSISPSNEYSGLFPLGLAGFISLLSKGLSRVFSKFKSINSLVLSLIYDPTLTSIHDYWKNYSFDYLDLSIVFQVQIHIPYAQ